MEKDMLSGFSKLNREQRQEALKVAEEMKHTWAQFDLPDEKIQQRFASFSENYLANYPLPMGVAPNFLIDGQWVHVPMVTEESSVIAAAAKAAKFWSAHGGFQTKQLGTYKEGQVLFRWEGNFAALKDQQEELFAYLRKHTQELTSRMENRGGGIIGMKLLNFAAQIPGAIQLRVQFATADSMGANFINTVLERMGAVLPQFFWGPDVYLSGVPVPDVLMAILSNYTPENTVLMEVQCAYEDLQFADAQVEGKAYAERFAQATEWAREDTYRAVTHNKGIMNGVDAVVLATGNDFRAVEADAHAFAARTGKYTSLSETELTSDGFTLRLELPLNLGVVGGLTRLHPLAEVNLQLMHSPSAARLMSIAAAVGLASNFSAVHALISSGIQKGHMKMHLTNLLFELKASEHEQQLARQHFDGNPVSYYAVKTFLDELR
jgi:hydroxymethylglutaryl-CoA reductase